MCGIVGAAARRDIVPVLIEGLRRLEYRGYDSCGLALVEREDIDLVRTVSRVADLASKVKNTPAGQLTVARAKQVSIPGWKPPKKKA